MHSHPVEVSHGLVQQTVPNDYARPEVLPQDGTLASLRQIQFPLKRPLLCFAKHPGTQDFCLQLVTMGRHTIGPFLSASHWMMSL